MNGFLFAWNHKKYSIEKLQLLIDDVKANNYAIDTWGISAKNQVKIGDKAFISRVNASVKGIFASGTIVSTPYLFTKYHGRKDFGVDIKFDVFFNPLIEPILQLETIKTNTTINQDWSPRKSGITLKPLEIVEKLWSEFCLIESKFDNLENSKSPITEGALYEVIQTKYERSQNARTICLNHYGYTCCVCEFNFKDTYGDIGNQFIHVHHINQLSEAGLVKTDPIKDLRPVCPNCHAMLHKRNPPYDIEELKNKLLL